MGMGGPSESRLAYVVDLLVQLRRDAECTETELHRRDRALMSPGSGSLERRQLLMKWLDQLRAAGHWLPGATVAVVFRLQLLVMLLAGFGVGWGVAAALFDYDGRRPINVVHILVVLVGMQLLLLGLLGVVSLPRRWTRYVPGLGVMQDILAWLSPGQITRLLARRLPEALRVIQPGWSDHWRNDGWPGRILKWAAIVSAQTFGVAFNLGALAAALYLVTFSDLAFSWSTTLDPDMDRGHRITSLLSAPWSGWLPEAVPSRELIESTLYYRQTGVPSGPSPVRWGWWWPFLVASMAVYGLMPRVLLLGMGWWRFSGVLRAAMSGAAGAGGVVDRLTTEAISTQALQAEEAAGDALETRQNLDAAAPAGRYWAINWSGAASDPTRIRREFERSWGCAVVEVLTAGGASGTAVDAVAIERIAGSPQGDGVLVLVKAWEPPMLEVLDFLVELRKGMGSGRRLVVVLLGLEGVGGMGSAAAGDGEHWRRRLGTLGDPELAVVAWEGERH